MILRKRSAMLARMLCLTLALLLMLPGWAWSAQVDPVMPTELELPSPANTAQDTKLQNAGKGAAVSLEEAIKIAKGAFTVPEGLDQFNTGFEQSEKSSFWVLSWFRSGEPYGEMRFRVSADTGEIWSMYRWLPPLPGQAYRGLPKYTREQAETVAAAAARELQPQRFKDTRLQPAQDYYQPLLHQERGQIEYRYHYARHINGIPFLENGLYITVSGDTGEVMAFDLNWDEASKFPAASGYIDRARAEQIFRSESSPQLFYFRPPVQGGKEVPLKLVYRLPGPQDQVLIDAFTGKLLKGDYYFFSDHMQGGGGDHAMGKMKEVNLTPVEEGAVSRFTNVITREKALEVAGTLLKIPQGSTLRSSRLEQEYYFREKMTWRFSWDSGEGENRNWIEVQVDALKGDLVSYYNRSHMSKLNYLKTPEVKYNEEAARKIAEDFIRKYQPDKLGQVIFKNSRPEYYGDVPVRGEQPQPREYTFNWSRVHNNIQFPENGFWLSVDSATGDVISYNMTWWDVRFPGAQGAISQEAAASGYLKESPLSVSYLRHWQREDWKGAGEPKIHLVYHLTGKKFAMLDAFTGQALDYKGDIFKPSQEKGQFDDIKGHPAREAVELLGRLGVVAGMDGKFRPDDKITQAELITMLVKSARQPESYIRPMAKDGSEPWYQPYYETAGRKGIIPAGMNPAPDSPVNRETLAGYAVNTMGLNKVARFGDIYLLNFKDAAQVSVQFKGHVAISTALGLVEPLQGKFNPRGEVTRAEAAVAIVKMLNSL